MNSKQSSNPSEFNAQQRNQQDTREIDQKETQSVRTPKQQTEVQGQRKLISIKNPPQVQRNQAQENIEQDQSQTSNFDDQNKQAQSPKKRRISHEQLYKVQQNLEDKLFKLVDDKFEELKKINIVDSLNAMQKIKDDMKYEFLKEFKMYKHIVYDDNSPNVKNEQNDKDQIEIQRSIQNPFNLFEQLDGVEESNYYYLNFEDTYLKVYVDVSKQGKWLRLWYKEENKVKGMLEDQFVSKAFSQKIIEKFENLGISSNILTINAKQNWIIREIQISCEPTSALKENEMVQNLMNGKTPKGKEYSKKQASGQFLYIHGKFDSSTFQKIPYVGNPDINIGQGIQLQIGSSSKSAQQIINLKNEKFRPFLKDEEIQCYLSHKTTRAFWLQLK